MRRLFVKDGDYTMNTPPIAVPIPEACRLVGVAHTKIYALIKDGTLETATVGKRRLVLYQSLLDLIDAGRSKLPSETQANWTPPAPRRRRAA
jgi:excisionase family DNA binding protein